MRTHAAEVELERLKRRYRDTASGTPQAKELRRQIEALEQHIK